MGKVIFQGGHSSPTKPGLKGEIHMEQKKEKDPGGSNCSDTG